MSKGIQFKTKNNEKVYPYPFLPVGSIYLSVTSTNPSTYFGGTWEQISKGRLLAGVGSTTDADGNVINMSNGETGGSKSHYHSTGNHTLTINEIPSHSHQYFRTRAIWAEEAPDSSTAIGCNSTWAYGKTYPNTYNTGGGQAHNHGNTSTKVGWPPFFAVYMWKRTK